MNNKPGVQRKPTAISRPFRGYRKSESFDFWFDPSFLAKRGIFGKEHPEYQPTIKEREENEEYDE